MQRTIDLAEFWSQTVTSNEGWLQVELDGTLNSAETLWGMILNMAMKDRAWCVQYDLNHPWRLMYVTTPTMYQLVSPPDEIAQVLVRAIDSITRPRSLLGRLLTACGSFRGRRVTRSFQVSYGDEVAAWVASWPRRAADGPIVLFRESYPGWDPSVPCNDGQAETAGPEPAASGEVTE